MNRGFALFLFLALTAPCACKFNPKINANGFPCTGANDCPSGYSCKAGLCGEYKDGAVGIGADGSTGATISPADGGTEPSDATGGGGSPEIDAAVAQPDGNGGGAGGAGSSGTVGAGGAAGQAGGGETGGALGGASSATASGGVVATSGSSTTAGASASGGYSTVGGVTATGGATGGALASAGTKSGGSTIGGTLGTGGISSSTSSVGGASVGGTVATGGVSSSASSVGGASIGGTVATGGISSSSTPGTGGSSTPGHQSAGCGSANTTSPCGSKSEGTCSLDINGTVRTYYLQLPANYSSSKAYPVVFQFHPLGGTAEQALTMYGFNTAMPEAIYVTPQGVAGEDTTVGWSNPNNRDINFTKSMLTDVQSKYCVDTSKVFAAGFSAGGMMATAVACELSDQFRAIASMSGSLYSDPNCPGTNHPISLWGSHGVSDALVPVADGRKARDKILLQNHCGTTTTPATPSPCVRYTCDPGYDVTWCEWQGAHAMPTFATGAITDFFKQF